MNMRLWTGKSKPWDNPYSMDLFKSWRWGLILEASRNEVLLGFETEAEKTEGGYFTLPRYFYVGLRTELKLGYKCYQYDGFHKVFSLGPLFINWYSTNE